MTETATQYLVPWQNFYVIVGSSAGALIGLQFVVIALVADMRRLVTTAASISAFGTPTVVHLGGALVISAVMSAPWPTLRGTAVAIGLGGVGGLGYAALVSRRALRQTAYAPVWEDWLWHALLPCVAYTALAIGALVLGSAPRGGLFAIGTAALGLLLIGIHNAWDTITYVAVTGPASGSEAAERRAATGPAGGAGGSRETAG